MLKNASIFPYSLIFYPIAPLTLLNLSGSAFLYDPLQNHPAASSPPPSLHHLLHPPLSFLYGPAQISPYLHALLSRDAHAHVRYLDHTDIVGPIT